MRILFFILTFLVVFPPLPASEQSDVGTRRAACQIPSAQSPKREMRGLWIATVWGIDWPSVRGTDAATASRQQAELGRLLDRAAALRFTTVCLQVRSMADVMYASRLEPWSAFLTGSRGKAPQWDPLAWAVAECHRRGLECYAWVNPFRWSTGTDYTTPADRQWRERGWLLTHGRYTVLNPGIPEVRDHLVDICREIVEGYAVDGLIFDDYFYPNRIPESPSAPDYPLYLSQTPWMTFGDWRRAAVHHAVADVAAMIRDVRPGCRFGISPAGVAGKDDSSAPKWGVEGARVKAADWQYGEIYSDPVGLMYQGTVDFISPQLYWPTTHATAPFGPLAQWWAQTACHFGSHLYTSVTLERVLQGDKAENVRDLSRQILTHRARSLDGNQGIMIYSAKWLPHVEDELSRSFSSPSLTPQVADVAEQLPEAPRGLHRKGATLSWQGEEGMRYTVYAIPPGLADEQISDPSGDGIAGAWLLGVTYEPRYQLPAPQPGYRYAVCAYTPFSTEGPPALTD